MDGVLADAALWPLALLGLSLLLLVIILIVTHMQQIAIGDNPSEAWQGSPGSQDFRTLKIGEGQPAPHSAIHVRSSTSPAHVDDKRTPLLTRQVRSSPPEASLSHEKGETSSSARAAEAGHVKISGQQVAGKLPKLSGKSRLGKEADGRPLADNAAPQLANPMPDRRAGMEDGSSRTESQSLTAGMGQRKPEGPGPRPKGPQLGDDVPSIIVPNRCVVTPFKNLGVLQNPAAASPMLHETIPWMVSPDPVEKQISDLLFLYSRQVADLQALERQVVDKDEQIFYLRRELEKQARTGSCPVTSNDLAAILDTRQSLFKRNSTRRP